MIEIAGRMHDWSTYSEYNQPVWFWILLNVKSDFASWGIEKEVEREVTQELKRRSLKLLHLRGNMLNLRKKHIPRIREIYKDVLEQYITCKIELLEADLNKAKEEREQHGRQQNLGTVKA